MRALLALLALILFDCSLRQCSALKLAHSYFPEPENFAQDQPIGTLCSDNASTLQLYDCADPLTRRPPWTGANSGGPDDEFVLESLSDAYGYTMVGFEHAIQRARATCPAAKKIHLTAFDDDSDEFGPQMDNAQRLFLQFGVSYDGMQDSKRKIVYQCEQLTSGYLQDQAYLDTCKQAKQVWTWGEGLARLQSKMLGREVLHVPMELALKTDVYPSPDYLEEGKVLFFGLLNSRRLDICESVQNALRELPQYSSSGQYATVPICRSAFGEELAKLVDKASVIFVMHFYEQADLEVHRINPLMAKGKVIVAEAGPDEELNQKYRDAGVQVVAKADISNTVVKLMKDDQIRSIIRKQVTKSFQMFQKLSLDNLCVALNKLVQDS